MRLFRKEALEALSAPEELDEAIAAVPPFSWVLALTLAFCVAVAGVWSVYGRVHTRVEGPALLSYANADVAEVVAFGSGRLVEVFVSNGDVVAPGEAIATVDSPAVAARVEEARRQVGEVEDMIAALEAQREAELREFDTLTSFAREANRERLADVRARQASLRERLANTEGLQERGFATRVAVEEVRSQLFSIDQEIRSTRQELIEMDLTREERVNQWRQRLAEARMRLLRERAELGSLVTELELTQTVRTTVGGEVDAVLVAPGTYVSPGTRVATVVGNPDPTLEVLAFIPALGAKQIEPGMSARVSPTSVPREEFGAILGRVVEVSNFPISSEALSARLQNPDLVRAFTEAGPPLLVRIEIQADADDPVRWSGGTPPPIEVTAGTLASASVSVRAQAPITLALPTLQRWFGL